MRKCSVSERGMLAELMNQKRKKKEFDKRNRCDEHLLALSFPINHGCEMVLSKVQTKKKTTRTVSSHRKIMDALNSSNKSRMCLNADDAGGRGFKCQNRPTPCPGEPRHKVYENTRGPRKKMENQRACRNVPVGHERA